jgi:hypothetical protein
MLGEDLSYGLVLRSVFALVKTSRDTLRHLFVRQSEQCRCPCLWLPAFSPCVGLSDCTRLRGPANVDHRGDAREKQAARKARPYVRLNKLRILAATTERVACRTRATPTMPMATIVPTGTLGSLVFGRVLLLVFAHLLPTRREGVSGPPPCTARRPRTRSPSST